MRIFSLVCYYRPFQGSEVQKSAFCIEPLGSMLVLPKTHFWTMYVITTNNSSIHRKGNSRVNL